MVLQESKTILARKAPPVEPSCRSHIWRHPGSKVLILRVTVVPKTENVFAVKDASFASKKMCKASPPKTALVSCSSFNEQDANSVFDGLATPSWSLCRYYSWPLFDLDGKYVVLRFLVC